MTEPETYETKEEAIAAAMVDAPDGEEIAVHEDGCEAEADGEGCTCTPEIHVVRRGVA